MMAFKSYYSAPEEDIFDEIKAKAIELWRSYDDAYGYATGKINRIKDIKNIKDNTAYIVAMFDYNNQNKLLASLNAKAQEWLSELLEYSRQQWKG